MVRQCLSVQAGGGQFRAAGQAQQLVLLYIYNATLLRLSAALGFRKLPEMLLHLIAAECPRIRSQYLVTFSSLSIYHGDGCRGTALKL